MVTWSMKVLNDELSEERRMLPKEILDLLYPRRIEENI
jgi:hypothetical protein